MIPGAKKDIKVCMLEIEHITLGTKQPSKIIFSSMESAIKIWLKSVNAIVPLDHEGLVWVNEWFWVFFFQLSFNITLNITKPLFSFVVYHGLHSCGWSFSVGLFEGRFTRNSFSFPFFLLFLQTFPWFAEHVVCTAFSWGFCAWKEIEYGRSFYSSLNSNFAFFCMISCKHLNDAKLQRALLFEYFYFV